MSDGKGASAPPTFFPGKGCWGSVEPHFLQKLVGAGLFEPDADKFGDRRLVGAFSKAHAGLARRPGALAVVAGPAARHTIVEIRLPATGNRFDVVDGQRLWSAAAVSACITIPDEDVLFGKRHTITVNASDHLD